MWSHLKSTHSCNFDHMWQHFIFSNLLYNFDWLVPVVITRPQRIHGIFTIIDFFKWYIKTPIISFYNGSVFTEVYTSQLRSCNTVLLTKDCHMFDFVISLHLMGFMSSPETEPRIFYLLGKCVWCRMWRLVRVVFIPRLLHYDTDEHRVSPQNYNFTVFSNLK